MARTSRITTVIKKLLMVAVVILPTMAWGGDNLSVDARFDRTGDGIVDASDWAKLSEEERKAYARASVEALGEDPDGEIPGGKSRAELYLEGLKAVYE